MRPFRTACTSLALAAALLIPSQAFAQDAAETGNVIFFHPDGSGVNHWTALRALKVGPDGVLNWDRLPGIGVYTGHMKNNLTATSHGGATVHAYGVKVVADSYGLDGTDEITAASGQTMSIAEEAHEAGKAVALVQTGHIGEPGTGVFAASVESRRNVDEIAVQVVRSGFPVLMAGGERYLLPAGVEGRHGEGSREDDLNLIEEAEAAGYTVVYNRDELLALDTAEVDRVLGVFARGATFNAQETARNIIEDKPNYVDGAPTIAEMTDVALQIIAREPEGFYAVIEEEGSDNFPNRMNAAGTLEALSRADDAIGTILDFIEERDDTLLVMAADSDAAGLQIFSNPGNFDGDEPVPATTSGGGVLHGVQGQFGDPFVAEPDQAGERHPFGIAFIGYNDVAGGILVRAAGLNHEKVKPLMDNTDVYKLMHDTLFGGSLLADGAAD
ncbi:MAG: alkaline phosphatase [Hyphomicrobiales bacterium]|nr:alkaline phosphatase [Hyphomicrobiales bacterium]